MLLWYTLYMVINPEITVLGCGSECQEPESPCGRNYLYGAHRGLQAAGWPLAENHRYANYGKTWKHARKRKILGKKSNQKCGWCSWIIHDVHWCSITMQCKLACSHCGSNLSWLPAVFSRPRIHPAKLSRAQGAKLGGLGLGAGPLCGSVMSVAVARFCKHVPHVAHVPHGKSLPLALVLSFSCPVASQLSFNLSQEFRWSWMGQAGPILVGLLAQMTISWWFKCSYWLLDGYDWICTCRLQYQSSGMDHECHKSLNDAWLQLGHFSANEFLRNRRRNFLLYTCSTPKENEMGMALKLQFKEATGWVMIYEYNDLWYSIPFWRFLTDSLVPKPPEHRAISRFANCGCFRNGCGVQRHGIDGSAPLHQDRGGKVTFGDGPTASTDTSITRPYLSSDFVWYDILVKTGQDQDESINSIDLESHHVKDQLSPRTCRSLATWPPRPLAVQLAAVKCCSRIWSAMDPVLRHASHVASWQWLMCPRGIWLVWDWG